MRRHRYIGACYGAPGLGKTLSARTYAAADDYDQWEGVRYSRGSVLPESLLASRTLFYTPLVHITGRRLNLEVDLFSHSLSTDINRALDPNCHPDMDEDIDSPYLTELVIIDEADRLKTNALEQLRDFFDRNDVGLILIGMPGFERQLARYPQLYSRIGFAHQYRPIDPEDVPIVLAHYWEQLGLTYDPAEPADAESANAITTITGGNFRLMTQIARVMTLNQLQTIEPVVVHAARKMLVVAPSRTNNVAKLRQIIGSGSSSVKAAERAPAAQSLDLLGRPRPRRQM